MVISAEPEVLFIDAYDSFSHSIVGLIQETLNANVHLIRIHDGRTVDDLRNLIQGFDAVVVGPGPGNPTRHQDVGISRFLWTLSEADLVPVFGICLGFQSMGHAFGGQIDMLREARHGIVCNIIHTDTEIFSGVGQLLATQYHSLQVVDPSDSNELSRKECTPTIVPLAYTYDETNGKVLMALKIRNRPFWGIQFHPESICTSENAHQLIRNWWKSSQTWLQKNPRTERRPHLVHCTSHSAMRSMPSITDKLLSEIRAACPTLFPQGQASISWTVTSLAGVAISEIYDRLSLDGEHVLLLDSQGHSSGRYSILGVVPSSENIELTFSAARETLTLIKSINGRPSTTNFHVTSQQVVWEVIREIMAANTIDASAGPAETPFWGGFIGYVSYEAGVRSLDIDIPTRADKWRNEPNVPDISFSWITRSIVVDHRAKQVYVQHLGPDSTDWKAETTRCINALAQDSIHCGPRSPSGTSTSAAEQALNQALKDALIEKPVLEEYCNKVELCKRLLASGESYELCLTDQTNIYLPLSPGTDDSVQEWALYKRLCAANPAPFGVFLRTSRLTIIGSSPERFLRWTRSGRCQFRPIKGTVKKVPGVDLKEATKILSSQKERAENLMIVDLIRHDLSGIVGSANCSVPKLMQVEEYQTVFQLVSVIEGQIPEKQRCCSHGCTCQSNENSSRSLSGIDVLAASLPPGSMTGAPKKRSCELLMRLENGPRGIYSGVLGYLDVGGGGDFSVVIRTAIKEKSEVVHKIPKCAPMSSPLPHHVWRIGAGGAVTIQSDILGEFEEMETKLDSVLRAFRAG